MLCAACIFEEVSEVILYMEMRHAPEFNIFHLYSALARRPSAIIVIRFTDLRFDCAQPQDVIGSDLRFRDGSRVAEELTSCLTTENLGDTCESL